MKQVFHDILLLIVCKYLEAFSNNRDDNIYLSGILSILIC